MTDAMPADPMSGTREGWVAMHEMFKGARGGGFGLLEAAIMVAAMVVAQGLKPPEA
jgi:hypothetical protein